MSNAPGIYQGVLPAGVPPGVATDTNELYASLLPMEWEGVGIPYTRMRLTLRQDLVIHKFADRDGAYVENTGRHPLQFEATIPFINTLGKGPAETWKQPLYPTQWRAFFQACAEGEIGILNHPELGPLTCKVETVVTDWEAKSRGGPMVQVTWIESDESGTQLGTALGQPSPISALAAATSNLDTYLSGGFASADIPTLPTFTQSFSQLFAQLASLSTQTTLLENNIGGQTLGIIYQAQVVIDDTTAANNALAWPILQAANQAQDAAYSLQGNLLTTGSNVSTFVTSTDSTLPAIATKLNTDLELLISLNVSLLGSSIVPSGSTVRYYAAA
jgi:hypothetical protein